MLRGRGGASARSQCLASLGPAILRPHHRSGTFAGRARERADFCPRNISQVIRPPRVIGPPRPPPPWGEVPPNPPRLGGPPPQTPLAAPSGRRPPHQFGSRRTPFLTQKRTFTHRSSLLDPPSPYPLRSIICFGGHLPRLRFDLVAFLQPAISRPALSLPAGKSRHLPESLLTRPPVSALLPMPPPIERGGANDLGD